MSKNLEEKYKECIENSFLIPIYEDQIEDIQSLLSMAEEDLAVIELLKKSKPLPLNTLYKLHYDIIHSLVEAFIKFDKIKSKNHECLFAYICNEHKELDLDILFFEKIRIKRNGIHYYGNKINYEDFKEIELQFKLYSSLLIKEIKQNLHFAAS